VSDLGRSQLLVYAAIAVAVLIIGARWIRSSPGGPTGRADLSFAADSAHEAEGTRDAVVHVAGSVERPGVYRLPAGSRVMDAVRRAGGFVRGANQGAINLAARLSDGQQVVVPGPARPRPRWRPGKRGRSALAAPRSSSSTRSMESGRSPRRRSSSSGTSMAASPRSTSWTRWTASGRPRWRASGPLCSPEDQWPRTRSHSWRRRPRSSCSGS
jgi:DNA uptake protein ComE-like DNA-binding protein